MKGTEKQIKWAEDIKRTVLENLQNNINRFEEHAEYFPYELKAFKETKEEAEKAFEIYENASDIIERRNRLYRVIEFANTRAREYRENDIK